MREKESEGSSTMEHAASSMPLGELFFAQGHALRTFHAEKCSRFAAAHADTAAFGFAPQVRHVAAQQMMGTIRTRNAKDPQKHCGRRGESCMTRRGFTMNVAGIAERSKRACLPAPP